MNINENEEYNFKIVNELKKYILSREWPNNSAAVFDIDGTILSTPFFHPIDYVIDLYKTVTLKKIKPIIITARESFPLNWDITINQLKQVGINDYKMLFLRNKECTNLKQFKLDARKKVHDMGYNVIMSIGDNDFDIGEYGGIGVLLKKSF